MRALLPLPLAAPLLAALAAPAAAHDEGEAWRIIVADQADPVVHVLDFADGDILDSFEITAPAALHAGISGRYVYAAQRDGGAVAIIDSGVSIEDHGDHADLRLSSPQLLELNIPGERPSHVVAHDGDIVVFFDGEGIARSLPERQIADAPSLDTFATAAPHHGVAARFRDHLLVSVPHPDDSDRLPIGIAVHDRAGEQVGEIHGCADLHGEAATGHLMAFACAEGLLLVRGGAAGPDVTSLPYPSGLPDGKVTTLAGGTTLQWLMGNWGPSAVVAIDPADGDAFRLVELPARRVTFAIDPQRSARAFVVTEDGALHRIDALSATISASATVTGPYSMDGHWSDPRPRLAFADGHVLVTDPAAARILVVDPDSLAVEREIPVEGLPFSIVAVGGSGAAH